MNRDRWLPGLMAALALGIGLVGWAPAAPGAPPPGDDLAEGRYPYLSPTGDEAPLVRRWVGLARALPDWKDRNKAAHYRFREGIEGRKCDQKDCHPGLRDAFVERLMALPEGPRRQQARERRYGLDRCADCHTHDAIWARAPACRLHFDRTDRVVCTGCHLERPGVLVALGEHKTIQPRKAAPLRAWPTHELTKEEKAIGCDRSCHRPDNPYGVQRVCLDCHGEGKLEISRYTAPGVLVHATARASMLPAMTNAFFIGLTVLVAVTLLLHIVLDIFRSRKEVTR